MANVLKLEKKEYKYKAKPGVPRGIIGLGIGIGILAVLSPIGVVITGREHQRRIGPQAELARATNNEDRNRPRRDTSLFTIPPANKPVETEAPPQATPATVVPREVSEAFRTAPTPTQTAIVKPTPMPPAMAAPKPAPMPATPPTAPTVTTTATTQTATFIPPAPPVTDFVDEHNVMHHKTDDGESLSRISKKFYGTPAYGIELAWFNGIDKPDLIYYRQPIRVPALDDLPAAPSGWPKEKPTATEIALRGKLVSEIPADVIAEVQEATPLAPPVPAAAPIATETSIGASPKFTQALGSCTATSTRVIHEGETWSSIALAEYGIEEVDLALLARNEFENTDTNLTQGKVIKIPCLGEIRPDLVVTVPQPGSNQEPGGH